MNSSPLLMRFLLQCCPISLGTCTKGVFIPGVGRYLPNTLVRLVWTAIKSGYAGSLLPGGLGHYCVANDSDLGRQQRVCD